ncbi:MAG: hypothetical protein HZY74_02350 [Brevundimonas sp.]|nr:MAG: hypothetical protein HZY74_02350 [Brevundimonas sp.]
MISCNGNGYWQNLLWQYPGLFDHDFNGFGGDEFTDTGGGDSSNDEPYSACTDRKADTQAATFNSKLATKPDANIREYGAILWQDSAGNVHMTDLFPGDINWRAVVDHSLLQMNSWRNGACPLSDQL